MDRNMAKKTKFLWSLTTTLDNTKAPIYIYRSHAKLPANTVQDVPEKASHFQMSIT